MPDAPYVHEKPENALRAVALLNGLWDEAREIAALRRLAGGPIPPGAAGLDWLPPDNVAGVHVFQEGGAWAADLTIDRMPPGKPACIGARVPLRDRQAAVTFATSLLSDVVLAHSHKARMPSALWPLGRGQQAFSYDGQAIPLPRETLDVLRACGAERIGTPYVRRRLEEVRKDLLGGTDLTAERLASMRPEESRPFVAVCALASIKGIPGWHRPTTMDEGPPIV